MIAPARLNQAPPLSRDQHELAANVRLASLLASMPNVIDSDGTGGYVVRRMVPARGEVEGKGASLPKAIATLTERIAELVLDAGSMQRWPAEWVQMLDDAPAVLPKVPGGSPVRTKERNLTIGLSTGASLHEALEERAGSIESTVSQVARDVFVHGLAALNRGLEEDDLDVVRSRFRDAYVELNSGESVRWMLRVDRRKHLEAQFIARELGVSLAQVAAWCVQFALRSTTNEA